MNHKPIVLATLCVPLLLAAPAGEARSLQNATVERIGATELVVRWQDADPVDVYVADRPDQPREQSRRVSEADRDGSFTLTVRPGERAYFLLRDRGDGSTTRVAERVLPLEQGSNFRDLGGYATVEGRQVKWGRIFRSGGTPLLTASDQQQIAALGIARMVDLRSSEERVLAPTRVEGVEYVAYGYSMGALAGGRSPEDLARDLGAVYRNFPTLFAPQTRVIFQSLLENDGPVVFNCAAGQDRTGFASAMVLSALGVPRQTILEDYHLSTRFRRPQFEVPKIDVAAHANNPVAMLFAKYQNDPAYRTPQPLLTPDGRPLLGFALEEIERRWGSVDGYLRAEIGLSDADIANLRRLYLE